MKGQRAPVHFRLSQWGPAGCCLRSHGAAFGSAYGIKAEETWKNGPVVLMVQLSDSTFLRTYQSNLE